MGEPSAHPKKHLSALTGGILVLGAISLGAQPVYITVEKPTPETVAVRTNEALLRRDRGGIAVRYRIEHFRGMTAVAFLNDFWLSLRPADDDGSTGVVHFVDKSRPDDETGLKHAHSSGNRITSSPVPTGTVTCVINYEGSTATCFVNATELEDKLELATPLAGGTLRTLDKDGQAQVVARDVALSAVPFAPSDIEALSKPDVAWAPVPGMTLLARDLDAEPGEPRCQAEVLGGIVQPAGYHAFVNRQRESSTLYVDCRHADADDTNAGNDPTRPLRTIGAAIAKLTPNTTVWVRKGVYPESLRIAQSGAGLHAPITVSGYPGEENEVIITGADRVVGWEAVGGGIWRKRDWPVQWYDWGKGHPGWESGKHPYSPVKRWRRSWREHLFLDGQDLFHVEDCDGLVPMGFTVDRANRICYLKLPEDLNPNTGLLEAARRNHGVSVTADFILLRGMVLEKFSGAGIRSCGSRCRFEHLTSRRNLDGFSFSGLHNIARNVRAVYNGQTGITGKATNLLIEDAELLCNNTKGITWSYHAGGLKICGARDVTLRRIRSSFNAGPGIWFDINNINITVEECTAIGNLGAGIFMEISHGPCLIRNNLAMDNPTGITVAETDNCTIIHNTCVRNQRGFAVRYGDRGEYTVRNLLVRSNLFAFNTKTQLDASAFQAGTKRDPVTSNYQSDHNLLWAGSDTASLINWETGPVGDLEAWSAHRHWDTHSVVADPQFLAKGPDDFRFPSTSPAAQAGGGSAAQFPDRFGRRQLFPSVGAIQPVMNMPWSSRTLKGEGETLMYPLPN